MEQLNEDLLTKGLLPKYKISKTNGKPLDEGSKYFVLRYDNQGSDPVHIKACQKALAVYADEIKDHIPQLSLDLKEQLKQFQ